MVLLKNNDERSVGELPLRRNVAILTWVVLQSKSISRGESGFNFFFPEGEALVCNYPLKGSPDVCNDESRFSFF